MTISKTKKTIILFAIIDAVLLAAYAYFMYDMIGKGHQVSELYSELHTQETDKSKTHTLQKVVQTTAQDRAMLNSYFVNMSGIVPFMETIETLGKQNHLSLSITSIANNSTSLDMSFKVNGEFRNVYQFLALLENAPYKIVVRTADFQKSGSNWDGLFSISLLSYVNK